VSGKWQGIALDGGMIGVAVTAIGIAGALALMLFYPKADGRVLEAIVSQVKTDQSAMATRQQETNDLLRALIQSMGKNRGGNGDDR
jgi:hypothetical protein